MKKIYFILILSIIPFITKSQDTVKRDVTLLKESVKIDSLISSLIHISISVKSPKNDSCLLLHLTNNRDDCFVVGLPARNQKKLIFDLGGNLKNSNTLGYFEFNGYLIFVFCDSFIKKFVTYSKTKKKFVIVEPKVSDFLSLYTGFMSWAIIYSNKKFVYGLR